MVPRRQSGGVRTLESSIQPSGPLISYFLNAYCVPGTVLGFGEATVEKTDKNPCPRGSDIPLGKMHNK